MRAEVNRTAGALWLGFGVLLFLALFPITLYKIVLGHNQDGSRPAHWLFLAAPAVVGVAWLSLYNGIEVFTVLYFGALALLPVMAYGIYPMRYSPFADTIDSC